MVEWVEWCGIDPGKWVGWCGIFHQFCNGGMVRSCNFYPAGSGMEMVSIFTNLVVRNGIKFPFRASGMEIIVHTGGAIRSRQTFR